MATTLDELRGRLAPASALARLPTGAKLFLILSAALLPLALIAFLATLQTTRTAGQEARARLRLAVVESSRALAIELIGDATALRVALDMLDDDPANAPGCARAQGVFAQQSAAGAMFQVVDREGQLLCGTRFPAGLAPAATRAPLTARLVPGRGVVLVLVGRSGATSAAAFFPTDFLDRVSRPSGFAPDYGARLVLHGSDPLQLHALGQDNPFARRDTAQAPLAVDGVGLEMTVRSAPITSPVLLALLLPILMWAAAATIGWLVVDHLLIRPLRRLRADVAAYVPGEEIKADIARTLPAQELRELGETFRAISRTVAAHEVDLAEGLVRQTRLTREVHHRVKNNLQVIASLINFHARGAGGAEAAAAYASIQRRVDALAVVHRNHFAEMEEHRGLALRPVIGELASNIRATAPPASARLGVTLDLAPVLASQDTAVAVAFLVTELVELAMSSQAAAQIRISLKAAPEEPGRAVLRVSSPALIEGESLQALQGRYGRVIEGLARQLRSQLYYDPFVGAYEARVLVTGVE